MNNLLPTRDQTSIGVRSISSNSVASPEQITAILTSFRTINAAAGPQTLFALANACYHEGSSPAVTLTGSVTLGTGDTAVTVPLQRLVPLVQSHCTLRQFCMAYAKVVWDANVREGIPPAKYHTYGCSDTTRYAGFDFFNGLFSPAVVEPPDGMIRRPTEDEKAAGSLHRELAIRRTGVPQISTHSEVVGRQAIQNRPTILPLDWN